MPYARMARFSWLSKPQLLSACKSTASYRNLLISQYMKCSSVSSFKQDIRFNWKL